MRNLSFAAVADHLHKSAHGVAPGAEAQNTTQAACQITAVQNVGRRRFLKALVTGGAAIAVSSIHGRIGSSWAAQPSVSGPANEPESLRLSRESGLVEFGKGLAKPKLAEPHLYLFLSGFWKVARYGQDLGESHSMEYSIGGPAEWSLPLRWTHDQKTVEAHNDAIIPVSVDGYDLMLRQDGDNSGKARSADAKNLYGVLFSQKYGDGNEVGVHYWAVTVAASSARDAEKEAMSILSATEKEKATIVSVVAVDNIQGYVAWLEPTNARPATLPDKTAAGRMSCSLLLCKSSEASPKMPLTSPKLYAGCFGATRGGKNGSGGEDQGVVFVVADQAADVHGREQALYGKKVVGFHYHQVEELSAIKGYTITLEKQEKLPARYLYAVVVTQKLDGLWAVIDRWIEFVAAADDEAAGREALSSARVTTSGKTEMEFCCRLDTVDGYTVVLHEAGK